MSLISTASPWTNDDTNQKKRTPSMRKTIKRTPMDQTNEYVSQEEEYKTEVSTMESSRVDQESRNGHVNELLNKITSISKENSGNKLADFKPIVNPALSSKTPDYEHPTYNEHDNTYNPLQIPPPEIKNVSGENRMYGSASVPNSLGKTPDYSNYKKSYEPPSNLISRQYNQNAVGGHVGGNDNRILDKINYMIHMLEEQHNEKTNNVTEEFILYTFLGVFVIFVVDSFSRAGRYIR